MEENNYAQQEQTDKLIRLMKKQNRLMRVMLLCLIIVTVVTVGAAGLLLPRTMRVMKNADEAIKNAQVAVENMAEISQELADADLAGMIEDTRVLVNESSAGIADAMKKLDQIEFDKLNKAIGDFQAVVEPLARLFGGGR